MTLATDGTRALVVYIDPLHESFHSVGNAMGGDDVIVFDTWGHWSEATGDWLITLDAAIDCLATFASTGMAGTDRVIFEPD